jgi:hypothetical protein
MKKLLFTLALAALPFIARAQTNIAYRVTVDGVNTSWSYDITGNKKDQARINGLIYAYGVYVAAQGTNAPLAMGPWLKQQHTALVDDYATQKQTVDNAAIAEKLRLLLTVNTDLLSNAQKTQLADIAALLP